MVCLLSRYGSGLADAVISCKTVSRSGTARFFDGTAIVCFREGQSCWLVCLLVTHLEDLLLRTVGDVSSDAGDGLADCVHLGLAPLDVDLRVFWSTTSNPL